MGVSLTPFISLKIAATQVLAARIADLLNPYSAFSSLSSALPPPLLILCTRNYAKVKCHQPAAAPATPSNARGSHRRRLAAQPPGKSFNSRAVVLNYAKGRYTARKVSLIKWSLRRAFTFTHSHTRTLPQRAIIVGHIASTCCQLVGNCVNASSAAAGELRPQCAMYVYA